MKIRLASRRGVTLVELMVAMAVGSVLMTVLAILMSRIWQANARCGEHLESLVALGRLGQQFRRDVHASSAAQIEMDGQEFKSLRLTLDDQMQVVYEITPTGLRRRLETSSLARQQEEFLLSDWRVAAIANRFAEQGEISLHIRRLAPDAFDARGLREFEIVGVRPYRPFAEVKP